MPIDMSIGMESAERGARRAAGAARFDESGDTPGIPGIAGIVAGFLAGGGLTGFC